MFHSTAVTPSLVVVTNGVLAELSSLYGAERLLLHTLSTMTQAVHVTRAKEAIVSAFAATGARLLRLEETFELVGEAVASRPSPGLRHILESRWTQQNHRLQHGLLELHIVGTTLRDATGHVAVLYSVAERRSRDLQLGQVAAQLSASRREAEATGAVVARHTGVPVRPVAPLHGLDVIVE